ncbi:hypothetical protein LCGC14_2311740, partial [marine sediment metagenome]
AEKEVGELTKKEVALASEKGGSKEVSKEVSHLLKRQTSNNVTKIGAEFQVNTYITDVQASSSVASLSNSQFVVTWESFGQDGSEYGVYGQLFNADGTKSGSEFLVNTYTTGPQRYPSVASLSNGNFIVTWESFGQDGDLRGVYGQIFNADGTKSGSEFQVNTYITGSQVHPSVASLGIDKFVVTWMSLGQDGDGWGIYGQIFNADGTKSGSEFQVNTYTADGQMYPSAASLSNGKFVVTWDSYYQDGDDYGVYGQVFNADGTKSGSEFLVNTYTTSNQLDPSVARLNNDEFVVTWTSDWQDGSSAGVYGQIFNADGTKNGSEFPVNTYTTSPQRYPSVASLSNDKFVVTWTSDWQDGSSVGVYGQIFNADGTKSGSEFPVNTYTGFQWFSSVANLNKGKFVVTWRSDGQDGDLYGVYGQIFEVIIPTSSTTSATTSTITSSTAEEVSGADRVNSIMLSVFAGIAQTIKGALGY